MTRRTLMGLAGAEWARGQLPPAVLYREYAKQLPDYIAGLARKMRERREGEMAKLTTKAAVEQRAKWARDTFWLATGGEYERTPLNLRTAGGFEREGYRVEKLIYESRPGVLVPANLYVPTTGKPPYPGVLFQMGHSANGKAAVLYQKCCQGLARLGYIVLAFDPFGQGERLLYGEKTGATEHHTLAGREMLLRGDTVTRAMTWDAVRSLDVLAGHKLVDPAKLASTGQSGGGMLTQMLACVDGRLAAAAVSCGNTENFACADFIAPGSTDDAEQNFLNGQMTGFDRWDMLYPIAPKPLLVMVSARDSFGTYSPNYIRDGRLEFSRLAKAYRILGHPERIAWKETPLAHALTYGLRVEIYNWFERWLKGTDLVIAEEPRTAPETEDVLRCGIRQSPAFAAGNAARPLRMRIAEKPRTVPSPAVVGRTPTEGGTIEALEIESEGGLMLPAWRWVPRKANGKVLVALDARGRNAHGEEGGMWQRLAQEGITVIAPDVRGSGDLAPEISRGAAGYARSHAEEDDYAWASLMLGRPLLAQRVADLLAVAGSIRDGRVMVAANGRMTVPATYAALADSRITGLFLAGLPDSFGGPRAAMANLLPGVLLEEDVPQLLGRLAPRRVERKGETEWTFEVLRAFANS